MATIQTLVILAGGAGTRMGSGSAGGPKHLLDVGGRPLLLNAVNRMITDFGVTHVVFRVAYQADEFVKRWMASELTVPTRSSVLVGRPSDGPIGALIDVANLLQGQTVLFSGGDVFYGVRSFRRMLEFHQSHDAPLTVGVARSVPAERPSTLVMGPDNSLGGWERKALSSTGDLINASLYLVDSGHIAWIEDDWRSTVASAPGKEYKEDYLWRLVLHRPDRARLFELDGLVVNVNTQDQLAMAREHGEFFERGSSS